MNGIIIMGSECTVASTPPLIVAISPVAEDRVVLTDILRHCECTIAGFNTMQEAAGMLGLASVVLCDAEMPDGDWRYLMRNLETAAVPPLLIVTSGKADNRLWAEVLNEGGYDVLAKPFSPAEVLHSVTSACCWLGPAGIGGRIPKWREAPA
jgi:CheY-like chemotaxis protein